ncbi:hypothetical protein ACFJIX_04990 [Roseateles sp. UC29_93]|uniref:hypothetical protein n=1 Tax=Roseateles sp. UC29_93 TaxID=3350177 RepID=UPI00366DC797
MCWRCPRHEAPGAAVPADAAHPADPADRAHEGVPISAGRLGSISARLVLMLALVAVVVFSAAGFLLHKALEQVLIADERADLLGKTEVVKHFIGEARSMDDLPMLRRHLAATSVGGRFRWNVWLVGRDGALLYGAEPMPPSVQRDGEKVWLRRQDGVELRGAHFRLPITRCSPMRRC